MFTGSHECVYCHCSLLPRRGAAIRYLRFGAELWFLDMIFLDTIFLDMKFLDMIFFATGSREQLDGENSQWSGEKENERSKRASCVVGKIVKSGMKWSE